MPISNPFGFSVDLSFWQTFFDAPLTYQAEAVFAIIGWVILAYVFFKAGAELWAQYREQTGQVKNWQWVLLAVDVPAMFIQTPKAVEQIFAHLSGALAHITVADKFWHGKKQKWFSFEIISIEGYIQFLVRAEVEYRDLIEAAIYAQYTEAEITEVEDYIDNIPNYFPNPDYDVMGVEFKLAEKSAYPIRTYPSFEYNLSKDAVFSDPMAAILENFSRLAHGENLWMQIVIEPVSNEWKKEGIDLVKELMGQEVHKKGGIQEFMLSIPQAILKDMMNVIQWSFEGEDGHKKEEKPAWVELSPGRKKTIEAVEDKIGKIGFKSKVRALYTARKENYHPNRCVEGLIGAMNQFHEMNRNALVPAAVTHLHYDRTHKKTNRLKNSFTQAFKKRKVKWHKTGAYILNIEELATIWHFPLPFVKTPLLQKAGYKRGEPPSGLPVEFSESPLKRKPVSPSAEPAVSPEELPPEELYG